MRLLRYTLIFIGIVQLFFGAMFPIGAVTICTIC